MFKRCGKGNDCRSTRPFRRTTAWYKRNFVDGVFLFVVFRCRGAATGVAGAVKVAPRGHEERTSLPPFPKLPPRKENFATFRGYIATTFQAVPQQCPFQKEKKKSTLVSCTCFTVPGWLQKCSFVSFLPLFSNCSLTFAADIC